MNGTSLKFMSAFNNSLTYQLFQTFIMSVTALANETVTANPQPGSPTT
jgi:hypothetical protein